MARHFNKEVVMRLMQMLETSFAAVAFAERGLVDEAQMIMRGEDRKVEQPSPARKVSATPRPRVRA